MKRRVFLVSMMFLVALPHGFFTHATAEPAAVQDQTPGLTAEGAKGLMTAKGYEVISAAAPVADHYEALARKDGEYLELHARPDGSVEEARKVPRNDPRWAAQMPTQNYP